MNEQETNRRTTLRYGLVAAFALVLIMSAAALTSAHPWNGNGPNYDETVHEQLEAAMQAGDFDAWVAIREENGLPMRGRMMSVMGEDSFGLFVQMHEANLAGDYEQAAFLRERMREEHQETAGAGFGHRYGGRGTHGARGWK